jgi:hypothetical protein
MDWWTFSPALALPRRSDRTRLNHPNNAQIYGFEESDNGCALIMSENATMWELGSVEWPGSMVYVTALRLPQSSSKLNTSSIVFPTH